MSVLIKGMKMPVNGNETIIRIQPNGTILDQYGHHLIIKAVHVDDVVEVVRCRECVFGNMPCAMERYPDYFCADGKRKDRG